VVERRFGGYHIQIATEIRKDRTKDLDP